MEITRNVETVERIIAEELNGEFGISDISEEYLIEILSSHTDLKIIYNKEALVNNHFDKYYYEPIYFEIMTIYNNEIKTIKIDMDGCFDKDSRAFEYYTEKEEKFFEKYGLKCEDFKGYEAEELMKTLAHKTVEDFLKDDNVIVIYGDTFESYKYCDDEDQDDSYCEDFDCDEFNPDDWEEI